MKMLEMCIPESKIDYFLIRICITLKMYPHELDTSRIITIALYLDSFQHDNLYVDFQIFIL